MSPSGSRPRPCRKLCLPSRGCDPITPCRASQVPGLVSRCALPPTTPEGPAGAYARYFPAGAGFIICRRLAALILWYNEAESGSLVAAARTFVHARLRQPDYSDLRSRDYMPTGNSHGRLLSVC